MFKKHSIKNEQLENIRKQVIHAIKAIDDTDKEDATIYLIRLVGYIEGLKDMK